jgi:hypothetical protein
VDIGPPRQRGVLAALAADVRHPVLLLTETNAMSIRPACAFFHAYSAHIDDRLSAFAKHRWRASGKTS